MKGSINVHCSTPFSLRRSARRKRSKDTPELEEHTLNDAVVSHCSENLQLEQLNDTGSLLEPNLNSLEITQLVNNVSLEDADKSVICNKDADADDLFLKSQNALMEREAMLPFYSQLDDSFRSCVLDENEVKTLEVSVANDKADDETNPASVQLTRGDELNLESMILDTQTERLIDGNITGISKAKEVFESVPLSTVLEVVPNDDRSPLRAYMMLSKTSAPLLNKKPESCRANKSIPFDSIQLKIQRLSSKNEFKSYNNSRGLLAIKLAAKKRRKKEKLSDSVNTSLIDESFSEISSTSLDVSGLSDVVDAGLEYAENKLNVTEHFLSVKRPQAIERICEDDAEGAFACNSSEKLIETQDTSNKDFKALLLENQTFGNSIEHNDEIVCQSLHLPVASDKDSFPFSKNIMVSSNSAYTVAMTSPLNCITSGSANVKSHRVSNGGYRSLQEQLFANKQKRSRQMFQQSNSIDTSVVEDSSMANSNGVSEVVRIEIAAKSNDQTDGLNCVVSEKFCEETHEIDLTTPAKATDSGRIKESSFENDDVFKLDSFTERMMDGMEECYRGLSNVTQPDFDKARIFSPTEKPRVHKDAERSPSLDEKTVEGLAVTFDGQPIIRTSPLLHVNTSCVDGAFTDVLASSSSPLCSSSPHVTSTCASPATILPLDKKDSDEKNMSSSPTVVPVAVVSPRCFSPSTSFSQVQERLKQQLRADQPISPSRGTSLGFRALIIANRKRVKIDEARHSADLLDSTSIFTVHSRLDRVSWEKMGGKSEANIELLDPKDETDESKSIIEVFPPSEALATTSPSLRSILKRHYSNDTETSAAGVQACTPSKRVRFSLSTSTTNGLSVQNCDLALDQKNVEELDLPASCTLAICHVARHEAVWRCFEREWAMVAAAGHFVSIALKINRNNKSSYGPSWIPNEAPTHLYLSWNLENSVVYCVDLLSDSQCVASKLPIVVSAERRFSLLRQHLSSGADAHLISIETRMLRCILRRHWSWLEPADCALHDPAIAAWLLDPTERECTIERLVAEYLPHEVTAAAQCNHPAYQASFLIRLHAILGSRLRDAGLWRHYCEVEMPCQAAISRAEMRGLLVNGEAMREQLQFIQRRLSLLEGRAQLLVGGNDRSLKAVDLGSQRSLVDVIYRRLRLPAASLDNHCNPCRRNKSASLSIKKSALVRLTKLHAFPAAVIEWRRVRQLLSQCLSPLGDALRPAYQANICETSGLEERLYPLYNCWTATGRIQTTCPNVQSVPRDSVWVSLPACREGDCQVPAEPMPESPQKASALNFRNFFVASAGYELVGADYSQLELRLIAHLSEEPELLRVLQLPDGDVFRDIAARWTKCEPQQVTASQRQTAKRALYGVMYGIGAHSLAEQLDVELSEAEHFMRDIEKQMYPGLTAWKLRLVASCAETGVVTNLTGRQRPLPHICSALRSLREKTERQVVNTAVQGTAADIVKRAMVYIEADINAATHPSLRGARLLLNMHDELLYEVPVPEGTEDKEKVLLSFAQVLMHRMESVVELKVPLRVRVKFGEKWGTLKEMKRLSTL